jgi:pheromone shutdown protein TraB
VGKVAKNRDTVKVLVIGTDHAIQRHQHADPARETLRVEFETRLRQIINKRKIDLIVEEAGDDKAVWEQLKRDEEMAEVFSGLYGDVKTADSPVSTIAKKLSDEHHGGMKHVDIRVDAEKMPKVEDRDEAMVAKTLEELGPANSVLVIVGEGHRAGVAERLAKKGLFVESLRLP